MKQIKQSQLPIPAVTTVEQIKYKNSTSKEVWEILTTSEAHDKGNVCDELDNLM
jgi:hypothetical protein